MAEMTTQQVMEYLKQISELETSVYQQTTIKDHAYASLVRPKVSKKPIAPPEAPCYPSKPIEPSPIDIVKEIPCYLGIIIGLLAVITGAVMFLDSDYFSDFLISLGVAAVAILVGLALSAKKYSLRKNQYPNEVENYIKLKQEADELYDRKLSAYKSATMYADREYEAQKLVALRAFKNAKAEVEKMNGPLDETKALLSKAYDIDIIFPKYRNMVAMCTMYEYFASGRCTELMGPTGAYNLYEAELRQNIIINQLEKVNENLEQVKQNQYVLYQGIAETNAILRGVSSDIKGILSMTTDIAVSSRITAFCSKVTAANASAQTYLELWN